MDKKELITREVSQLFKRDNKEMLKTDIMLLEKRHGYKMSHDIVDEYNKQFKKIRKRAYKLAYITWGKYGDSIPYHELMNKIKSLKIKYDFSNEEFDLFRKLYEKFLFAKQLKIDGVNNNNMVKILGHRIVQGFSNLHYKMDDINFKYLQEILKYYETTKDFQSKVILQSLTYNSTPLLGTTSIEIDINRDLRWGALENVGGITPLVTPGIGNITPERMQLPNIISESVKAIMQVIHDKTNDAIHTIGFTEPIKLQVKTVFEKSIKDAIEEHIRLHISTSAIFNKTSLMNELNSMDVTNSIQELLKNIRASGQDKIFIGEIITLLNTGNINVAIDAAIIRITQLVPNVDIGLQARLRGMINAPGHSFDGTSFDSIHPVIVALFLTKIKKLDEYFIHSNLGEIISNRYKNEPITNPANIKLIDNLINDYNDVVCNHDKPLEDLLDRVNLQNHLWHNIYWVRNLKFFHSCSKDLLNCLNNCKQNKFDNPEIIHGRNDFIVIKKIFNAFSYKPTTLLIVDNTNDITRPYYYTSDSYAVNVSTINLYLDMYSPDQFIDMNILRSHPLGIHYESCVLNDAAPTTANPDVNTPYILKLSSGDSTFERFLINGVIMNKGKSMLSSEVLIYYVDRNTHINAISSNLTYGHKPSIGFVTKQAILNKPIKWNHTVKIGLNQGIGSNSTYNKFKIKSIVSNKELLINNNGNSTNPNTYNMGSCCYLFEYQSDPLIAGFLTGNKNVCDEMIEPYYVFKYDPIELFKSTNTTRSCLIQRTFTDFNNRDIISENKTFAETNPDFSHVLNFNVTDTQQNGYLFIYEKCEDLKKV